VSGQDEEKPNLLEADDFSETTMKVILPPRQRNKREAVPVLRVIAGRDMLRFARLVAGEETVVGREAPADLIVTDSSVSRQHCVVRVGEDGRIGLVDMGSTNGTRVNQRAVERVVLKTGDQIEVGTVVLRLDLLDQTELSHLEQVQAHLEARNRDPLTGLLTRTFLSEDLPLLAYRCDRARLPFTCAFFDVDHFKRVNDVFGHQVGDEVLQGVARLLLVGLRASDSCVRYGGEEVLIFMPGTDEDAALEVGDRLRRSIQGHDWSRTAAGLRVTVSAGVSQRDSNESLDDWIHRADLALYQAKANGRNRINRASATNQR